MHLHFELMMTFNSRIIEISNLSENIFLEIIFFLSKSQLEGMMFFVACA